MSNMTTEKEPCERRARRSSESITSIECRLLKQPVSASRTLFSCASLKSSAFFTDAPSSAAAAASTLRCASVSGGFGEMPMVPMAVPATTSGKHWTPPPDGSLDALGSPTARCAARSSAGRMSSVIGVRAIQSPLVRNIAQASRPDARAGRCSVVAARIESPSSECASACPKDTRRSISATRELAWSALMRISSRFRNWWTRKTAARMNSPGTSCRPRLWSISRARSSSVPSWREDTTQVAMAKPPMRKTSLRPNMRIDPGVGDLPYLSARSRFPCVPGFSGLTIGCIAKTPRPVAAQTRADAFSRLFEAVREGVFMGSLAPPGVELPETTLAANAYLKLIFAYPAETPETDVAPFARERFVEADAREALLSRVIATGAATHYLLRRRRVTGSPVWVEVTARARPSRNGGLLRVEALVRDVSERKRLDDQSKDIYQQILQSEKMAALGQTISAVAHELHNPLPTILSRAERLSGKPLDDTPRPRRPRHPG